MCFTWRCGNETARREEGPVFDSRQNLFFSSLLFCFFSFSFTFSLLFSYCSFDLFLYIAQIFKVINFLPCCLISPSTPCRSPVLSHSIGLENHFNAFQIRFPPIFQPSVLPVFNRYPLVYVFPYKVTGHSFVMIVPVG